MACLFSSHRLGLFAVSRTIDEHSLGFRELIYTFDAAFSGADAIVLHARSGIDPFSFDESAKSLTLLMPITYPTIMPNDILYAPLHKGELRLDMKRGNCEMSTSIYVLKPIRREMPGKMTREEEAAVEEHFEYLRKASAEQKVILTGRCLNGEFGIVVFRAESEEQAEEFLRNDRGLKKRIMTAELHPFRVALMLNGEC